MRMLSVIECTKKAFGPSYQMRCLAIEKLVRDLLIISNDSYDFVRKWTCQEQLNQNVLSDFEYGNVFLLLYYNKKYDSYLNACITQENVEWYWVPKQLEKIETHWVTVKSSFPTVLHSDEDDVTGLIKFARAASSSNINIKVDESGAVYISGVNERLREILDKIKDATIGLPIDKMRNLFGKTKFTVISVSPSQKDELLSVMSEKNALQSVYLALSTQEACFAKTAFDSSTVVSQSSKKTIASTTQDFEFNTLEKEYRVNNKNYSRTSHGDQRQPVITAYPKFFWTFFLTFMIFILLYFNLGWYRGKGGFQQKLDFLIASFASLGIAYAMPGKKPTLF